MAEVLLGKKAVNQIAETLALRIAALKDKGCTPTLAMVRMGARTDDISYERTACRRAEAWGISVHSVVLAEDASQQALENCLRQINVDPSIHGCLLFRPLPRHIDEPRACEVLDAAKDVDGVTLASLAAVFTDGKQGFPPSTAAACIELLDCYGVPLLGKQVVVVGRSLVVGKPVSMMLLGRNASVTMCHSRSENLAALCRQADIVICATGRARAFGAEFFRAGQTVLDVGINFDEEGNLCGDVNFAAVEPVVSALSPVPGGLGMVTTALTMSHVVSAAESAWAKSSEPVTLAAEEGSR